MALFGKNKNEVLVNPLDGVVKPITEVCDPVFAGKMMGDGIAITPKNGSVVAPCDGKITMVFPTKHAIGIQTKNGVSILMHFGVDTVNLDGKGFEVFVANNQKIKAGDKLWEADIDYINENAKSTDMIIVFAEPEDNVTFDAVYGEFPKMKEILTIKK